jgi:hypothetical protein
MSPKANAKQIPPSQLHSPISVDDEKTVNLSSKYRMLQ